MNYLFLLLFQFFILFCNCSFPTRKPSIKPITITNIPSLLPTTSPSLKVSSSTSTPSNNPTYKPSFRPTRPTTQPTLIPTNNPSSQPTISPSIIPTYLPSIRPTTPTTQPTLIPTRFPTTSPTIKETTSDTTSISPTTRPSNQPSFKPTLNPTRLPISSPTIQPSIQFFSPTRSPTRLPSQEPTNTPSFHPSAQPVRFQFPTFKPSLRPSSKPSLNPSLRPTLNPTLKPSSKPSISPTSVPTYKIQSSNPKHIVIFMADDLGWDDVGFHGNTQVSTPFIDSLARSGVIIDKFYVQPQCSPSRSALLTGRSCIRTSLFDNRFLSLKNNFTLLPFHLSRLGYSCHMIGKWHLGDTTWSDTPLYRGFKTSFGIFSGSGDHYTHNYEAQKSLDLWDQKTPRFDLSCWNGNKCPNSSYSTHIFTNRAIEIIENSKDSTSPLFLYISFTSPHLPYQAPQDVIDLYNSTISNPSRRVYVAMLHVLDNAIQNITKSLERNNMLNDTLILFMSDNGAMVDMKRDGTGGGMGSNWPLRGSKRTLYEGGVRVPAFITGSGISSNRKGQVLNGLFHISDWFPTLLTVAAKQINSNWNWENVITYKSNEPIFGVGDGKDQWSYISGETDIAPRNELLLETHELGSKTGNGNALIIGNWKILLRTASLWPYSTNIGSNDGWFGGPNSSDPELGAYAVPIGVSNQNYTIKCPSPPSDYISSYACENKAGVQKDDISYACLFNLATDPCEQVDLSSQRPSLLTQLWNRLNFYRQKVYEYPCTRCKSGLTCPADQNISLCSNNWRSGAKNCMVEMPC